MKEVAQSRGFNPVRLHDNWLKTGPTIRTNSGGVFLCDYDRDGRIDVLITDLNGFMLYRGLEDGHFEDVTLRLRVAQEAPARS